MLSKLVAIFQIGEWTARKGCWDVIAQNEYCIATLLETEMWSGHSYYAIGKASGGGCTVGNL